MVFCKICPQLFCGFFLLRQKSPQTSSANFLRTFLNDKKASNGPQISVDLLIKVVKSWQNFLRNFLCLHKCSQNIPSANIFADFLSTKRKFFRIFSFIKEVCKIRPQIYAILFLMTYKVRKYLRVFMKTRKIANFLRIF